MLYPRYLAHLIASQTMLRTTPSMHCSSRAVAELHERLVLYAFSEQPAKFIHVSISKQLLLDYR
jgi:hypothetical protein